MVGLIVVPTTVRAQTSRGAAPVLLLETDAREAPEARRQRWRRHLRDAARREGHRVIPSPERFVVRAEADRGSVRPARLEALSRVERLLVRAREQAAALRESRALALLGRAARLAEGHADVPGSAAWIAEAHIAIGITAAQAGLAGLSDAALSRAATLDGSRAVRAAEAPPALVERAARIRRAVATRPAGRFEVDADAPNARVYLDDAPVGRAPATVRAPVGRHVLRVEAPGYLSWGTVIEVLEGQRAPIHVRLSPTRVLQAARTLPKAGREADYGEVRRALARLKRGQLEMTAWVLHVGAGPQDRAFVVGCDARGCGIPQRLEPDERAPLPSAAGALEPQSLRDALAGAERWVNAPAPPVPAPPSTPWWRRWYVWAAAGAAAAAITAATVLATRPSPNREFRTEVEFDDDFFGGEEPAP